MYTAFTQARKDVSRRSIPNNGNPSVELWNSDSEEAHPSKTLGKTFVENDEVEPITTTPLDVTNAKGKVTQNVEFYQHPFVFKEPNRDTRDLVASPFTNRIRDYNMPDGLKVPTNLKTYDGMSDLDDHLTVFMGTTDVHKLTEPVWCRLFPITLCGPAGFWFSKETLHMADRSDAMVSGAFISDLRPGRLFKDLIARPPTSLEDLFTQTHSFIRAEDANNQNRLREPRQANRETKQHATYKDLSRRSKDKFVSRAAACATEKGSATTNYPSHWIRWTEVMAFRNNIITDDPKLLLRSYQETDNDMTGIPRELAEHMLNIHPQTFLVWQKKRVLAKECSDAITQEVSKLVDTRILRAVFFPSGNPNSTASTFNPSANKMETLTVESPIPTVSSPVPTACLNDSSETSSEARLVSKRVANQEETPSLDNILSLTNRFDDILGVSTSSDEIIGVEADVSNMETSISASPTPTHRTHKDHPKSQIIGPVDTLIQT
nr:retrotransposon Gag domain-containing protein [Tanacetum cinerariifolium]